ncbi:hypothetical protein MHYP_G00099230 [Metynnis hypsauchen]
MSEDLLLEAQCCFFKNISTVEKIFTARQLQGKYREKMQDLVFMDLSKIFHSINDHDLLWIVIFFVSFWLVGISKRADGKRRQQAGALSVPGLEVTLAIQVDPGEERVPPGPDFLLRDSPLSVSVVDSEPLYEDKEGKC